MKISILSFMNKFYKASHFRGPMPDPLDEGNFILNISILLAEVEKAVYSAKNMETMLVLISYLPRS